MAIARRDERGGAQLAGGFEPKHRGVLTSVDFEFLKIHEEQDSAQRAADARLKLRTLSAQERDDSSQDCEFCGGSGEVTATGVNDQVMTADCPDCSGAQFNGSGA